MTVERQAQQKSEAPEREQRTATEEELAPELEQLGVGLGQEKALREPLLAHPTARTLRQRSALGIQRSLGNAHFQRTIVAQRRPEPVFPDSVVTLRTVGGQIVQPALKVNLPGDRYEQ